MSWSRDVGALGYESVGFLERPAAAAHFYFSLSLSVRFHRNMAVIVSNEDVDNCVCISLRVRLCLYIKNATVWADLVMFNLSGSLYGIMNNLLSLWLCEPLFWQRLISNTSFPLFLFPSFLPSSPHPPNLEVVVFSGHLTQTSE